MADIKADTVALRVKERHEIDIGRSHVSGCCAGYHYFPRWRRPITEGRNAGCIDVISFESYRHQPPGPQVRWWTKSGDDIGLHRLVRDGEKWFVELLEEDPLPPERLETETKAHV